MSIENGLYSVRFFNGTADFGSGTVSVTNGAINGGDHGFSYQGNLVTGAPAGDVLPVSGTIKVERWNNRVPSVINGLNDYALSVAGSYEPISRTFELQGEVAAMPGVKLRVVAARLGDLAA